MLLALHIRDFVIVEKADIQLDSGFTVFSGETGAGKSILIDALALTLGQRADVQSVREGADRADISAEFEVTPSVQAWLEAQDIDSTELLLRRTIDRHGKSKAFINGIAATASQLRALGEQLVDIHGQHAHQSLMRSAAQRRILDSHAGLQSQVTELQQRWQAWQKAQEALELAQTQAQQQQLEQERLAWQLQELEHLQPQANEWQQINQDYNRLAHAQTLIDTAASTLQRLDDDEYGVTSVLQQCAQQVTDLLAHDPNLANIQQALESAAIACQEASHDLNLYVSQLELDPQQLEATEKRMRMYFDFAKKFHTEPEHLVEVQARLQTQLHQLQESADIAQLQAHVEAAQAQYRVLAQEISAQRQKTARDLGQKISHIMQELAMQGGVFEVTLKPSSAGAYGLEEVQFNVAGHAGTTPRELAKVASGGELARISLALSVTANKAGRVPTLIFDEVDTGIGGAVAEIVGRLLRQLGRRHQVLCVTHLPQVAACADHHFMVHKQDDKGITRSDISALDETQRIEEVARMLGGLRISDKTRQHAKEMLQQAHRESA
ncbi:DNA repair protein RecN [Brackiella oedipodis]|uniref:DNA repair protein RecN n=1 Tax=Brackiella oedipodis TaxID=124225 RepID=UPI0004909C12|nr:DNA repair protein RecN [Brackiella oedipodis]